MFFNTTLTFCTLVMHLRNMFCRHKKLLRTVAQNSKYTNEIVLTRLTYAELIGAGASRPRGNFQCVKIILRGRDALAPIYAP